MTRRSLKPGQPLLLGSLFIHDRPRARVRPALGVEVYCPCCHDRRHVHGWGAEERVDAVSHRASHCVAGSLFAADGYWIGLDPSRKAENRKTLAEFVRLDAEWQARFGAPSPSSPEPLGSLS